MSINGEYDWPYPGSRWRAFDFHTHTPASLDTYWAMTENIAPEEWLLRFMRAEIDCVAITDHNSGDWIDILKEAYDRMLHSALEGNPTEGFRRITLFPGVEISVNGGFHLLAIFDPSADSRKINNLLARSRYSGSHGDSDGVTRESPVDVVELVLDEGGIPIPAHADQEKGLLQVREGTRECVMDANTVSQVVNIEGLLALEWVDHARPLPTCVADQRITSSYVLGSDCHSFRGQQEPGQRFTWIKMATPSIEGLRLALLDGNDFSVAPNSGNHFDPYRTPAHFIKSIEINSARFMGNGEPERIALTPYYNALIGGRGTGKSTTVHALRLAYHRQNEIERLKKGSEPLRQFESFCEVAKNRTDVGALRDQTSVCVEIEREGVAHRLTWTQREKSTLVEEYSENDADWRISDDQELPGDRFPVRIFSQGQIAAMAGDNRTALLDVIDDAAGVRELKRVFTEEKQTYFSQRARIRELEGQLANRPELMRRLADTNRKLEALTELGHAAILNAKETTLRQKHEIDDSLSVVEDLTKRMRALGQDTHLAPWTETSFDQERDSDAIAWKSALDLAVRDAQRSLLEAAEELERRVGELRIDGRMESWRARLTEANDNYLSLQDRLTQEGVDDPQAFGRIAEERQDLERRLEVLDSVEREKEEALRSNTAKWQDIVDIRHSMTVARQEFVSSTLRDNQFVRIAVIGFGFEPHVIEDDLRDLLEIQDGRFEGAILQFGENGNQTGLAADLADEAADQEEVLRRVKTLLTSNTEHLDGRFRNYMNKKLEQPEFYDHIQTWFPSDDLRIEYSRSGDGDNWSAISQASQGQRSAALLGFLLSFGEEPLVLDQPEDDLDNHLIYGLIVQQIRENKPRRQLVIVTHNPNIVVNGDAEMVHTFDFRRGQCRSVADGSLQDRDLRLEVCRVMEGGHEAFARRWARLGNLAG